MINFDPFAIGPAHKSHSNDVDLITLESSGRNFCQKCLQQQALENFDFLSDELFQQYVRNLLEALDQKSENPFVRSIILPILEVITTNKFILAKDENHFHETLRIFNRVIKSYKFEPNEFTLVARVFSRISCHQIKSIPLVSCWKIIDQAMLYAKIQIDMGKIGNFDDCKPASCRFFSILLILVQNYLNFFKNYELEQMSDIIFPLSPNDDPLLHNKKFYYGTQIACINYISNTILTKCLPYLEYSINGPFSIIEERDFVMNLYSTLDLCLERSVKLDINFLNVLDGIDSIAISHKLIYHNTNTRFRNTIRKFLSNYVKHNIGKYFEFDEQYSKVIEFQSPIVETNHLNVKAYSDEFKITKIIFYLLLNSVASKTKSRYFNTEEVLNVVQTINLDSLKILSSTTLIRSFCYLVSNLSSSILDIRVKKVKRFLRTFWSRIQSSGQYQDFDCQFCYDHKFFFWAYEHKIFISTIKSTGIRHILEKSIKDKEIINNISTLICHDSYKNIITKFFKEDEYAFKFIQEVIKLDLSTNEESNDCFQQLIDRLSGLLPALLHNCLLESITDLEMLSQNTKDQLTQRLLEMNIFMLKNCKKYKLILDEQFVSDFFKYMENLYQDGTERCAETIILMNELISDLLTSDNPSLLFILRKMEFCILGYAIHSLKILDPHCRLIQSIAYLLMKYNDLDYPVKCNLLDNLNVKAANLITWMMSDYDYLHKLALQVVEKVIERETSKTYKVCLTSALIHLIEKKPEFSQNPKYFILYSKIINENVFALNPLKSRILDKLEITRDDYCPRTETPISMPDTDRFEEDQIEISHIINQMEEGNLFANYHQIPDNLFVSGTISNELPPVPDIRSWETMAFETISTCENDD